RADVRRGSGLGPGPGAGRAGPGGRHRDGDLRAVHRLLEGEANLGLEVAAPLGSRTLLATPAAEERGEDVAEVGEAAAPAGKTSPRTPPAARPEAAEHPAGVVLLPLLGIRERVVGLLDLLELLLGLGVVGVPVRVPLAGELAVGLLDLVGGGGLAHPEGLVE